MIKRLVKCFQEIRLAFLKTSTGKWIARILNNTAPIILFAKFNAYVKNLTSVPMRVLSNFIFLLVIAAGLLFTCCSQPGNENHDLVIETTYGTFSDYKED